MILADYRTWKELDELLRRLENSIDNAVHYFEKFEHDLVYKSLTTAKELIRQIRRCLYEESV